MSREELTKLTVKELDGLCRERNIPLYNGKNHINKTIMIERLLDYAEENPVQEAVAEVKENVEKVKEVVEKHEQEIKKEVAKEEHKKSFRKGTTIGDMVDMESIKEQIPVTQTTPWVLGNKAEAIEKADVGTLIAFIDEKGKPRTAKLVNRSSSRQVIKVTTEFDWTFIVPYDKVLWVRFGTRWPKTIYNMLKGYKNGQMPYITSEVEEQE